jgi:hypothetical protein
MNVISLDSIFGLGEMKSQPAPEASGCTTSSCGSSDGPSDMAPEVWEKVKNHPCYSEEGLCNLRSGNSVGGTAKLRLLGIPYSWSSIHPGGPIALQET